MPDEKFEVGDAVRVKTGGPTMTVAAIRDDLTPTKILCKWFTEGGTLTTNLLPPRSIEKVE